MKYLPLFHHFKAIYQFPKHIIFWVKIVANASLKVMCGWSIVRERNKCMICICFCFLFVCLFCLLTRHFPLRERTIKELVYINVFDFFLFLCHFFLIVENAETLDIYWLNFLLVVYSAVHVRSVLNAIYSYIRRVLFGDFINIYTKWFTYTLIQSVNY